MARYVTRLNVGVSRIAKRWHETPVHGNQSYGGADYV